MKRQEKRIKSREEKIAAVHEGWTVNGKRTKLVDKRHYVHEGKEPFWEGFEGGSYQVICVSRTPYIEGISVDWSAERRLRWDGSGNW